MCAAGAAAVELVLPAGPTVGDDAGVTRPAGRAVHADAVLWIPPDDGLAAERGVPRQSQARAPAAAAIGVGGDLSEAQDEYASAGPSDLSVPVARSADHAGGPGLELGHHVHPVGTGVAVPGGDSRLVQPVRRGLGGVEQPRQRVLCRGVGAGAGPNPAGIFNTDQGSQFTSQEFTGRLLDAQVRISMDGRGRALDNVFVERLWRTVKYEEVYLKSYETVPVAIQSLGAYFRFYNEERLHQALAYRTPATVYYEEAATRARLG